MWFGVFILVCINLSASAEDSKKLLGAGSGSADNTNYCEKQWQCGSFKHFMCEFKKNSQTEKCSKIVTQITDADRMEIVKLVNEFRNNLAGGEDSAFPDGAKNIQQMTWDYKLEGFAEVYGSQCGSSKVPDLDPCAKTKEFQQGTRFLWGVIQNGIDDVVNGPEGWTSEIPDPDLIQTYIPVEGEDRLSPNYGRFTMLAWATTYKIGCSIIECTCSPLSEASKKLVCVLGPSGNIGGKPVFFNGEACQSCPADTSCKSKSVWPKLCARTGDPDNTLQILSLATPTHSTYTLHLNLLTAILVLAKY